MKNLWTLVEAILDTGISVILSESHFDTVWFLVSHILIQSHFFDTVIFDKVLEFSSH